MEQGKQNKAWIQRNAGTGGKAFLCTECRKRTILTCNEYEWGWRIGGKKFCTYSCMRKYAKEHNYFLYCTGN